MGSAARPPAGCAALSAVLSALSELTDQPPPVLSGSKARIAVSFEVVRAVVAVSSSSGFTTFARLRIAVALVMGSPEKLSSIFSVGSAFSLFGGGGGCSCWLAACSSSATFARAARTAMAFASFSRRARSARARAAARAFSFASISASALRLSARRRSAARCGGGASGTLARGGNVGAAELTARDGGAERGRVGTVSVAVGALCCVCGRGGCA